MLIYTIYLKEIDVYIYKYIYEKKIGIFFSLIEIAYFFEITVL